MGIGIHVILYVYYQLFLDGSNWGVSIHRASKGLVTKYGDGGGGLQNGRGRGK